MGCFSTCFGTCKRSRRRRRRVVKTSPSLLDHLQTYQSVECLELPPLIEEQEDNEKGENQIEATPDSNDNRSERPNSSERKKVTFDLNVKIYEELPREDVEEMYGSIESNNEEGRDEGAEYKGRKVSSGCQCNSDSSSSSLFSFPPNHRYQNFRDSDDEFEEGLSSDESDIDDYTDDDHDDDSEDDEVESEVKIDKNVKGQEQSSESLFSLSLDSRKQVQGAEIGEKEVNSPMPIKDSSPNNTNLDEFHKNSNKYKGKEVNSPMPIMKSSPNDTNLGEFDRNSSKYIDSVLNPVENLTQWKCIKARSRQASKDNQAKENMTSGQDFSFPVKKEPFLKREIGVDTSLSTWLMGSEGTLKNNNSRSSSVSVGNSPSDRNKCSPNKFEDRPILGALTLEELRQFSASNSPRKSPGKSPDDKPIIGSVGSYWSTQTADDTGSSTRSTKSKFRESAEVIWDPTPFETRLEKALEKEANAGQILAV